MSVVGIVFQSDNYKVDLEEIIECNLSVCILHIYGKRPWITTSYNTKEKLCVLFDVHQRSILICTQMVSICILKFVYVHFFEMYTRRITECTFLHEEVYIRYSIWMQNTLYIHVYLYFSVCLRKRCICILYICVKSIVCVNFVTIKQ